MWELSGFEKGHDPGTRVTLKVRFEARIVVDGTSSIPRSCKVIKQPEVARVVIKILGTLKIIFSC